MERAFLIQALLYLSAAVLFVPIAKKLGLGSILGYLIAGIVIGPFILGLIGQEGQDIMNFGGYGFVMMLFLVGLQLEPSLLWRIRSSILGMGGMQVGVTTILVTIAGLIFQLPWNQALALGLSISLSSTAITVQTLAEKGLLKTSAGQSSLAVLLFQDIAVIPILALMPLLAIQETSFQDSANRSQSISLITDLPPLLKTFAVLGAVAIIILAGKTIVRPLLRMVAGTKLRELFTATALLLVIAITILMTLVGLSPALGTFLAGVVLANSEFRHELESDIEPFKGLLLGLFFIAVGASINFYLIIEHVWLIAGLVSGIMFLKSSILYLTGRFFKMGADQSLIFAVGLSQVGEFAFVLLAFAQQLNILPESITGTLLAVVACTMAFTPFVTLLNEKILLPRVGTKMISEEPKQDAIDEKNPVIIAGFGRFGNITGRFLTANGIGTTVLDVDSDRVELLRKLGLKVYYGDATRYDLLKAAGAQDAQLIVIALDDTQKRIELVKTVKKHFPHLHILTRAHDRTDYYDFLDEGVLHIYRETLDTALTLGVDALQLLGHEAYRANRAARIFKNHDEQALKHLAAVRGDQQQYINTSREKISQLEQLMLADLADNTLKQDNRPKR
jgi:CPA2 family monovalent cation:H+ antiporter-2